MLNLLNLIKNSQKQTTDTSITNSRIFELLKKRFPNIQPHIPQTPSISMIDLFKRRFPNIQPHITQTPTQPQSPAPQPFQPPQIENMPQIIPTDLMNRFPFIPFQPPQFNELPPIIPEIPQLNFPIESLNTPSFNYPTDRFGMPQIIPTELIGRMPGLFRMPRYPIPRSLLLKNPLGRTQLF